MLPFHVHLQGGAPVYEQVVFAVKKAVVSGLLGPGDSFPSVRTLSQELQINPNTAQKIVSALTQEGLLEVHPGKGTLIASGPATNGALRKKWLEQQTEKLVVEASHHQIGLRDVLDAVEKQWKRITGND